MLKYNRIALLITVNSFFVIYGCTDEPAKTVKTADAAVSLNFDSILNCYDYSYLDHYFFTADYGCIYDPEGKNSFGNLTVYLIPYKNIDSSACDAVAEKITSLGTAEIKRDFDAFVYLIPKEHLHYNASADPVYYPKENYIEKLYSFDNAEKKWYLIDSFAVTGNTEQEQKWRENFIQSKIPR